MELMDANLLDKTSGIFTEPDAPRPDVSSVDFWIKKANEAIALAEKGSELLDRYNQIIKEQSGMIERMRVQLLENDKTMGLALSTIADLKKKLN
jgi:hypothetical protein